MSAITTQKELLAGCLVAAGIPAERIALGRELAEQLGQANVYPYAKIISDTAHFELAQRRESQLQMEGVRYYKQVRCKVLQPFIVQVFDRDEESCTGLIESLIENLPYFWEYKGLQGMITLRQCEHSDFYSVMNGSYESALLLEFEMDIGPEALGGRTIRGIDQEE